MLGTLILRAVRMLAVLTLLTGVLYPLGITLLAQIAFPTQANGSLIAVDGAIVGSALIGQQTDDPRYFSARPSAVNYMQGSAAGAPVAGGATNISSASARLEAQVLERAAAFHALNGLPDTAAVPADMLFASGSGLDPHISPRAALLQAERVAAARGLDPAAVIALVEAHVEQPLLGFLGEPRVNVLQLNLALNQLQ